MLVRSERWILGGALGLLWTMFLTFVASAILGFPLTLFGFLAVQIVALLIAGGLWFGTTRSRMPHESGTRIRMQTRPSTTLNIVLLILFCWTLIKIGATGFDLLTTPTFFNDSITNWNARAKVFFVEKKFSLRLPSDTPGEPPGGIRSYPPAIPLAKAWFATLAGKWNEGLVNAIHMMWFLALLLLVFLNLRRHVSFVTAALGTYLLSSVPLVLLHGLAAYADIFMALHLFIPAMLLFHALHQDHAEDALSFLRLSAFAIALVPFTKNEGLLLYFPPLILFFLGTHWHLLQRRVLSKRDAVRSLAWILFFSMIVVIPWLAFKWTHGLPFGNAKPLGAFGLAWQPGVLQAVGVSLFFHGSWLLLFPLLLFLLVTQWRAAFTSKIFFLTSFFLMLFFGQLLLYLFTGLGFEALKQTGYGRGLLHLMPLATVLMSLLIANMNTLKNHSEAH